MSFDFKSCFWDPHDDGVNILLQHISNGIKSLYTLEQFFRQRADLAKDYSRRLSAIDEKLNKDLATSPDFGHLNDILLSLSSIEKSKSSSYAKQYEFIQGRLYQDIKLFHDNYKAKYITITGKIENLRRDKFDKRKGCEDLAKKLKEAEIKYRDYKLNENNTIGNKRTEQNNREIIKWATNVKEITTQLSILKNEYKASQKFWLKEWALITEQLQDMESERITYIQTKLQDFININMETSILEQTKLEFLNNELTTFTPMDDISKFSNDFGTGRLKEKHQPQQTTRRPQSFAPASSTMSNPQSIISKRETYMENIRKLSDQLQKTYVSRKLNDSIQSSTYHNSNIHSEKPLPVVKQRSNMASSNKNNNRVSLHESQLPSYSHGKDMSINDIPKSSNAQPNHLDNLKYENNPPSSQHSKTQSESSTTSSSTNPTDFTSHLNGRRSIESMSTSVTSMASSIDDNQRFAKSWNSTTKRKRKSMSHISSIMNYTSSTTSPTEATLHHNIHNSRQDPHTSEIETRKSSTNTILRKSLDTTTRPKSMVITPSSNYGTKDTLFEMNKLQGGVAKDSKMGRVNDNGIIVTLPIVTRSGNPVIKYAKALYPLLDNSSPDVINFDKNDYLLITEEINNEWFLGEVYDNEMIHPDHRVGLIPFNFIQVLD